VNIQEKYISRCLQLAKKGLGFTRPNPMVGCVIVYMDRIIGEGFTSPYGGSHAEVNAIAQVKNKEQLKEATLYVSLEPCNHTGKTPPCTNLIKKYALKKVVVGCVDPFDAVDGKGIASLRAAGIDVEVGVLEKECIAMNKRFFTFHREKRPFIVLKWAQTIDGYFDKDRSQPQQGPNWISNEYAQQMVHKLRAAEQAVLVGTTTAINDNPSLTVRSWHGQHPVKVLIDRSLRVPKQSKLFATEGEVIVFTEKEKEARKGVRYVQLDFSQPIAAQICSHLYDLMIQSVLIEGGAKTLQSFLDAELWDEAYVFTGAVHFGAGLKAPAIHGQLITTTRVGDNELDYIQPVK